MMKIDYWEVRTAVAAASEELTSAWFEFQQSWIKLFEAIFYTKETVS